MNTKQKKINKRIDVLASYILGFGGIVMFILPAISRSFFDTRWEHGFWSIVILSIALLLIVLISITALFFREPEVGKIATGPKNLQKLSPKTVKVIGRIVMIIGIIGFGILASWFLSYSIKGIDYLYIQNKKPVTETDLVVKARAGTGTSKFTVQNVEFENLGKLRMWFTGLRFKQGRYYEVTMIPDTKYILDRNLIEE